MSLIEVMVTMTVLGAAFLMYSGAVVATSRQRTACHESAMVADAAQRILEEMRSEDFRTVYALYNENPFDDPAGTGTAPGCNFDIPGLDPWPSSTETSVGRVHLPAMEIEPRVWQLRENQQQADLGMPRDLSDDSIVDDRDHALDYQQLPVRVTVRWQSRTGPRHLEIDTLLVEFRR